MKKLLLLIFLFVLPFIVAFYYIKYLEINKFPELNQVKKDLSKKTHVLMFGSSFNHWNSKNDTDRRSVSEMIGSKIDLKTDGISHAAYGADIFLEFCKYIIKQENKPKIIIIEINLRSFSAEWDMRPETQFVKERVLLSGFPYVNLKFHNITPNTFSKQPVYKYDKIVGTINDFTPNFEYQKKFDTLTETKKGFIMHYMYELDKNHRKLKSLKEISEVLVRNNIIPIFFVAPIDYKRGELLFGKEFTKNIKKNVSIIKSIFNENITVLDYSYSLETKDFDYVIRPYEHLKQYGKLLIASSIANKIKEIEKK